MQVGSSIILDHFEELEKFTQEFGLLGEIEFAAPVLDTHGKVLIKENILFNASMFARLKNYDGEYDQKFEVKLTPAVLRKIRAFIGQEIARSNRRRIEFDFVDQLLENLPYSLSDMVAGALQSRRILLAFFKLYFSDQDFFNHGARLGVLALAVATRLPRAPMLRRYSFLAGLCADLALVESEAWKYPVISGPTKKSLAVSCARFAAEFQLPEPVLDAIADHPVADAAGDGSGPAAPGPADRAPPPVSTMFAEILSIPGDDELAVEQDGDSEAAAADGAAPAEQVMRLEDKAPAANPSGTITEILRIARYVDDVGKRTKDDPARFAEEAIYYIAYLSGRGLFEERLSNAVIAVFRKYRAKARRVQLIAAVEKKCIHPPSAWAYPRPTSAAQIVCQARKFDCPHIVPNWSMHVVSPADAYGWLGAVLEPGDYPKCEFGQELKKIKEEEKPEPSEDEEESSEE